MIESQLLSTRIKIEAGFCLHSLIRLLTGQ
jgi:hypothetical protein